MSHTVIIGGGLTGLFFAHRLVTAGHEVTLLEARESLGGRYRRPSQTLPYSSPGLDLIPASQEHLQILEWLKNLSPIPLSFKVREHCPQIFVEGSWRPFAGFGESGFQSVGELSALFAHTSQVELHPGLDQLVRALNDQLPFAAQTLATATAFKVEDGKITGVTVNGDKRLACDAVIFTPPPQDLSALFEGEDLPLKHRARLSKMQSWTAVTLELHHRDPLVDDSSVRFFTHTAREFEPVVGRVSGQISKWLTLIPGERAADHEFAGQCIRHIKRQLKRAWPLSFESAQNTAEEKIYIQTNAYGQHSLRTKEIYCFPEISNLYLTSHLLSGVPGELGALEPARALAATLLADSSNKLPELGASC